MSDPISRQAAIDGLYEMASDIDHLCTVGDYVKFLESLPSAQPEQKIGKIVRWMEKREAPNYISYTPHCKCSLCGNELIIENINFCYICGAKIVG